MAGLPSITSTDISYQPATKSKAVVIGIYGVPGSGKSHLLKQLKDVLQDDHFAFYEGSAQIAELVPGGLAAFKKLPEPEMVLWRQRAIDAIATQSAEKGKVAIVTGHLMFWTKGEQAGVPVYTQNDLLTFTHILYLDVPAWKIVQRRENDKERSREVSSIGHLQNWQLTEKNILDRLCSQYQILLSHVSDSLGTPVLDKVLRLTQDARSHTEAGNLSRVEGVVDKVVATYQGRLETMLVFDADKTLAAEDTGKMFWEIIHKLQSVVDVVSPLDLLFSSSLKYSYTAFRQATWLYENATNDQEFDDICTEVAAAVTMYPEFLSLLQVVGRQKHVGAVVVTCGLRRVWEKVLERYGLSQTVAVIGGGRIADGIVVTATVKGSLVKRLRNAHHFHVWAFGDSPLDMNMLCEAHKAVIVVGTEHTRSKTMETELSDAIGNGDLSAQQVLLPSMGAPRLDTTRLPVIQLTDPEFVESLLSHRHNHLQFLHAMHKPAAKLLATSMRDAHVAGPALRRAHGRVGFYLATEYLTDLIGLEECPIKHVLGHSTSGYRLFHESQTIIVALMRGGEPMAFGVNKAFPEAMFLHADEPEDIKLDHLQGITTVILVDSVVNSGKTVVDFVKQVRKLSATIRVVIVAGVVQDQAVVKEGTLDQELGCFRGVSLVALRLSETKFTGTRGTDTGNRLFNTTHLD
ncbi:hypothetical protein MMC19_002780 [Ptychographa xylographoides]|nr:hypothetical protein [Ptychographa xylographoides]